jgi:hypothetical protein
MSVWIKTVKAAIGCNAIAVMLFLDEKKARIPKPQLNMQPSHEPQDWKCFSGSVTAPKGARYAEIMLILHGEGEVYFDDLELTRVSGSQIPTLPVLAGRVEDQSEFTGKAAEAAPASAKVFRCALAKQPPKLDGLLDDPCWAEAGRIDDFVPFGGRVSANLKTVVLACADRDALYFGFDCDEPQADQIIAKATERDGPVWSDDSVEIFLDTRMDGQTYYQIILNAKGVFFDQDTGAPGLPDEAWNGPIQVAAKIGKDRWTAEVKIELAGLRLAESAGRMWRANFCRTSLRSTRNLWSWVDVKGGFHEPKKFGQFVLPFDPSADSVTGRVLAGDQLFWGEGGLPFAVSNNRAQAVPVRLIVSAETKTGARPVGEVKLVIPPKTAVETKVPASFSEAGSVNLGYALREEAGGRLLYVTSVAHMVPPPLAVAAGSRTSYMSEKALPGSWTLGIAPTALADSKLLLTVKSGANDLVTQTISPDRLTGAYSVPVSDLPAGNYEFRAELTLKDKRVAFEAFRFERIAGPFSK